MIHLTSRQGIQTLQPSIVRLFNRNFVMVDFKNMHRFLKVCRDTSQSISYPVCHACLNSCIIHNICSALLMLCCLNPDSQVIAASDYNTIMFTQGCIWITLLLTLFTCKPLPLWPISFKLLTSTVDVLLSLL